MLNTTARDKPLIREYLESRTNELITEVRAVRRQAGNRVGDNGVRVFAIGWETFCLADGDVTWAGMVSIDRDDVVSLSDIEMIECSPRE